MNIVKKVIVAKVVVLALIAATLLGSKFHDKIDNGITCAKNKVVSVFKKSDNKASESDNSKSDSDAKSATSASE